MAAAATNVNVKPLNGAEGYLRWKESMLLRLHTVGVAHVLSDDPPPPPPAGVEEEDGDAAARRRMWARDDAVCRGHILAALSDRIFPDYVRHRTARDAWDAVARTYDNADAASAVAQRMLYDDLALDGAPAPLLERIARAEALNAATRVTLSLSDAELAELLCQTVLPANAAAAIRSGAATMRDVWRVARIMEAQRVRREDEALHGKCRKCGRSRHHGCNCMR
ncbi:uncharacterized protein [Oryza sativa Japonica Group]|uniref:Retrotransposon protein, putative, Ty1-copia subclass n=2 Tax=Oryza TaxID=4527 RepID=Q6ZID9_ORYSJ|nr:uncharacterized protein LOC107278645 [Oryza sativa Japonica Group]EAZ42769.1 hypothetical protein OsJ_27349 [Oryza sativa Japonica Group]BAC99457.1 hypothetical protein [Oryza sativa Japonica Group]